MEIEINPKVLLVAVILLAVIAVFLTNPDILSPEKNTTTTQPARTTTSLSSSTTLTETTSTTSVQTTTSTSPQVTTTTILSDLPELCLPLNVICHNRSTGYEVIYPCKNKTETFYTGITDKEKLEAEIRSTLESCNEIEPKPNKTALGGGLETA